MRFTFAAFVLAATATAVAAAAAVAPTCAACAHTLVPGVDQIRYKLVCGGPDAMNTTFCGYKTEARANSRPEEGFCSYNVGLQNISARINKGGLIPNSGALKQCPRNLKVEKCKDVKMKKC
ncbi:hypothetical protein FB451DRAFT_1170700 [Mycena latifolia]|nr:hypothetical protein FB451DRAFT_1170700 [Mycena latifolia]